MSDANTLSRLYAAFVRATLPGFVASLAEGTRVEVEATVHPEGGWSLATLLHNERKERQANVTLVGAPFDLAVDVGVVTAKALELELGEPVPFPLSALYLTPAEAPRWIEERVAPRLAGLAAELGGVLLADGDGAAADPLVRLALMIAPDPAAQRVVVPASLAPTEPEPPAPAAEPELSQKDAEAVVSPTPAPAGTASLSIVELVGALMRRQGCDDARADRFVEAARSGADHPGRAQSLAYLELRRELGEMRSMLERRDRLLAFLEQHWSEPDALLCASAELGSLLSRFHEDRGRLRLATLLHGLVLRGVAHEHPLVRLGFRELGRKWLTHHLLGTDGLEQIALQIFDRTFPHVPGVPLLPSRQRGRNLPGMADLVEAEGDRASAERLRSFARHYLGMRAVERDRPS